MLKTKSHTSFIIDHHILYHPQASVHECFLSLSHMQGDWRVVKLNLNKASHSKLASFGLIGIQHEHRIQNVLQRLSYLKI